MSKDQIATILNFVSQDDEDFTSGEFMLHWPTDPSDQNIALAMLSVRNTRQMARMEKTGKSQWPLIIVAMAASAASLAHVFGAEPLISAISGLGAASLSTIVRLSNS